MKLFNLYLKHFFLFQERKKQIIQSFKTRNFFGFISKNRHINKITLINDRHKKSLSNQKKQIEQLENQIVKEINKNEQKETLLQLQSRQAQMGEMINAIAHQWRQPLNALSIEIASFIYSNAGAPVENAQLEPHYQSVMQIVNHLNSTLECFQNFLQPSKAQVSFSLFEEIQKILAMIEKYYLENDINITIKGEQDLQVLGYPNEFQQVILNLLQNAKDAILETKPKNRSIVIYIYSSSMTAYVEVADFGGGIPESLQEKIFDPYFTTKPPNKGTGVGLYMSKTIIEKMNGRITVKNNSQSSLYLGALFKIQIPAANKS